MLLKKYLCFLLLLIPALVLSNCKPDNPCDVSPTQNVTYNLDTADINKIPYRTDGRDTLVYISDEGDTATLYGQGAKRDYDVIGTRRSPNPDCQEVDAKSYETIEYYFKGTSPLINTINYKVTSDNGVTVYFNINNISLYDPYFEFVNYTNRYIDTVLINSKIYNGVLLYSSRPSVANIPLLYNYKFGILKITKDGLIWRKQIK